MTKTSITSHGLPARLVMLLGLSTTTVGHAADHYFQPTVEVEVQQHTNRELATESADEKDLTGYIGMLEALWGIATPRSDTQIRPRLKFQEYPDEDQLARTEQFLDWKTSYKSLRSDFSVIGQYSRRDSYNAAIADVGTDDLDPTDPGIVESGVLTLTDRTQTRIRLRPEYLYKLSERIGVGARAEYQMVDNQAEVANTQVDFDYSEVQAFLSWTLAPRMTLDTGLYAGKFETDDETRTTDTYGGLLSLSNEWAPNFETGLELTVERNDSERTDLGPGTLDEKSTDWGLMLRVMRRGQVDRLQLLAGRMSTPSSAGNRASKDQIKLQYQRDLSERMIFTSAATAYRGESVSGSDGASERNFARGELSLRWLITQTWFVSGGYQYTWQEREDEGATNSSADNTMLDADNNMLFVSVGYQGLGRQKR